MGIMKAAQKVDGLISRDFSTVCVNVGIFYMKALPINLAFIERLLNWLWYHPYEFDQHVFGCLLGQIERWDVMKKEAGPTWENLDPENAFVTRYRHEGDHTGWSGNLEDVVVCHFLDGGAAALNHRSAGADDDFDLFYNNTLIDLGDDSRPLWLQD